MLGARFSLLYKFADWKLISVGDEKQCISTAYGVLYPLRCVLEKGGDTATAGVIQLCAQPCVRGREQHHCHLSSHPVIWHFFCCPATISKMFKE